MRGTRFALVLVPLLAACARHRDNRTDRQPSAEALDFRRIINSAKEKVFPAVVYIKCLRESMEGGKKVYQDVSGSGVLISPRGEIVTNWHVVDKATETRCLLSDGSSFEARVVGSDKDTDLALLQLQLPPDHPPLPFAKFGDSNRLREGDFVMAMGAPWGMSRSVSLGIVGATRRFLPGASEYSLWLQTDASISPGNSGGPLLNSDGEVVGINARGVMQGGDMGFAIPAETVKLILAQLREFGKVTWSWTGIQLQPLKDFNKNMYFEATEGVLVAETDEGSPARRAGLIKGDRILRVNGKPLNGIHEEDLPLIRRELGLLPKNAPARFEVMRGSELKIFEITPREKGKVEGEELECKRWDLTVKSINQFDNPDLYYHRKEGVFVFGVKVPGNASDAGLQQNDILDTIEGKKVVTLEDVRKIHEESLRNIEKKYKLSLKVVRGGLIKQIILNIQRDYSKE